MADFITEPPFRLVSDVVLPDCTRIVKGVYREWPEGLPVPKSAQPVTFRQGKEPGLPIAVPDVEVEDEGPKKKTPNTLKALTPKSVDEA